MRKLWIDAPIKRSIFLKFLQSTGVILKRCHGDHFLFNKKPKLKRPVSVTLQDPVPKEFIKNSLKVLELEQKDFLQWLDNS
jgi:hypothetical protein